MKMEIMNEVLTMVVVYQFNILSTISEGGFFKATQLEDGTMSQVFQQGDPLLEYNLGTLIISILMLMLAVNLVGIIRNTVNESYSSWKQN